MNTTITLTGSLDTARDMASLFAWLNDDDELRGRVQVVRGPTPAGAMGSITDVLTVALGVGGAGTALVNVLSLWIRSQRSQVRLTVKRSDGRQIELQASNIADVRGLVEQLDRKHDET
jgi:hypothetical protein